MGADTGTAAVGGNCWVLGSARSGHHVWGCSYLGPVQRVTCVPPIGGKHWAVGEAWGKGAFLQVDVSQGCNGGGYTCFGGAVTVGRVG